MMRRSLSRALASAIVLGTIAGCADPASVKVEVLVREEGLAQLVLRVIKNPAAKTEPTIECTFPAGAPAEPGCALEDGTGRWAGGTEPLSFYLYGRPKTDVKVEVDGVRAVGSELLVVSSTTATFALPERAGDRGAISLELLTRTAVHEECAPLTLSSEAADAQNDRSALVLGRRSADGTRELVASIGGNLATVDYVRGEGTCGLVERSTLALGCRAWDNSLVVSRDASGPASIVAALCANTPTPTDTRLVAVLGELDGTSSPKLVTLTGVARSDVSRPVLADLDGDGLLEVYVLAVKNGLVLVRWDPRSAQGTAPAELPLAGLTALRGGANDGPIVVRTLATGDRDFLVIAGYPGGVGVVAGAPPTYSFIRTDLRTMVADLASAATYEEHGNTAEVTVATLYPGTGMRFTSIEARAPAPNALTFVESRNFDVATPDGVLTRAAGDVRVAIGDVTGDGTKSAVVAVDGQIVFYPSVEGGVATARPVWTGDPVRGPTMNPLSVLLANVDGQPGAEVLAFEPGGALVYAVDARGRQLDGWPVFGIQGGLLRALVAELDGAVEADAFRDLELVLLSRRTLRVVKLGAGTYDRAATPWPSIFHDARGTALHGPGERDPSAPAD